MRNRHTDWEPRLLAYLQASFGTPFKYGDMDCALFVSGAVFAMTGQSIAEESRGKYSTLLGGFKEVQNLGFKDHFEAVRSLFAPVHPAFAQVGDIAVVGHNGEKGLGIMQGQVVYVMTEKGFGFIPREFAVEAFSV